MSPSPVMPAPAFAQAPSPPPATTGMPAQSPRAAAALALRLPARSVLLFMHGSFALFKLRLFSSSQSKSPVCMFIS